MKTERFYGTQNINKFNVNSLSVLFSATNTLCQFKFIT